jgi:hypothetical protein
MSTPALTVALLAPTDLAHIEKTVRHLRAQTRVSDIELVLVTPNPPAIHASSQAWREFHSVRLVLCDAPVDPVGARILAVRASSAPLLAFAEDHAFPAPNWAEQLIAAYAEPYAAVGVEMRNENPSAVSRADMLLSFGPWTAPARRGLYPMLPGHNTSYRLSVLQEFGDRLPSALASEAVLHRILTQQGKQLYLENRTFVSHVNISSPAPFIKHKLFGGRIFAASRWQQNHWRLFRRLLYGLAAPIVPIVRLMRLFPDLKRVGAFSPVDFKMFGALLVGLVCPAAGEMLGYWFGIGNAVPSYAHLELFRESALRLQDRQLVFE